MKRTQGIQDLVSDALASVPQPYGPMVIEDVCLVIEREANLRQRYDDLCANLRQWVVNNWIGQYVKMATGMNSVQQVSATRSALIGSYTRLAL